MNKFFQQRKAAFSYAFNGIGYFFKNETHAKIHSVATILVIIAGIILNVSAIEWCVLIICIGGVLMGEAINTSIEKICDKVSPEYHVLIKASKDTAAGAVLLFVIASVAVGLIIFIPKIITLLK